MRAGLRRVAPLSSQQSPTMEGMLDDHDLGLPHDLGVLIERRRALAWFGSAGVAALLGACGDPVFGRAETEVVGIAPDGSQCVVHPRETAGPYPADGSNRAHGTLAKVLDNSGIVRGDMRPSLVAGQPVADGTPLELTLKLVDAGRSCAPLGGHAIYLWHCDAGGRYSIYDLPDASYLRAVGVTDDKGAVTFTTVFPGCYPGRFPHMHFEVYPSLAKATSYENRILTSQLAMPEAACHAVYQSSGPYVESIGNFARSPLSRDGIFADNSPGQLAAQTPSLEGDPAEGYRGEVLIGLKA
jgi:protocatechuate 3,4-dioxygenase beta subunit